MTTKTQDRMATRQGNGTDAVKEAAEVIERAMSHAAVPEIKMPAEIQEKAQHFMDNYAAYLNERTEAYAHRMATARPEAGEPALPSGYQYWNCLTVGPVQFYGDELSPYRPSKIIAAGELTLMLGVVWINPLRSDGGGLPGTVVLGGRDYTACFETINLSKVMDGPDGMFASTFDNRAQVVNLFPWWFVMEDPGERPDLYETTFTIDIVQSGQPMAAFSTWHLDLDTEPGFLAPSTVQQWQHDIPARFLVYRHWD